MARPLDPFRTLELPRDATLDEVKTAYRRLAKLYHPDSAGERALPRFLAVQAAYEALTEGPGKLRSALGGRPTRAGRPSTDPWAGRPAGTGPRATRGTTTGSTGTRSGGRPGSRSGSAGTASGAGSGSGPAAGEGAATGGRTGSSRTRGPAGPRPRRTRRAPGSTSYDGAESEPFEPEWQGASWYGGSSGTYWTINPREFADPRKHGPDYLARGAENGRGSPKTRRARAGDAPGDAKSDAATAAGDGAAGEPSGPSTWGPEDGTHVDWTTAPGADMGTPAWGNARPGRGDVSPFGLVAAALLAVALVAIPFAIMAEPTAPGTSSVVPVVAFCGIAIVALVRVLRRDGRPRA
jgi:curved DNA-binding protein CbpA